MAPPLIQTIHQLRKDGWKVRVIHGIVDQTFPAEIRKLANKFTRIELRSPDGHESVGIAYLSKKDNHNRKLGNKIALARAFHNQG
jgi:hypothetical protein